MQPMRTTLLDLVQVLADLEADEPEIVATAIWLVNSGRVVLSGSFAGQQIVDRTLHA